MSDNERPTFGGQRGGFRGQPGGGFGRGGGPGGFNPRERRGGGRARRGDIQAALLALLIEEDMHGYQIIGELAERSGGAWRPGAGSVYPTLRILQEQGLITSHQDGSKRVFSITPAGRRMATAATDSAPWQHYREAEGARGQLRQAIESLVSALAQVEGTGTEAENAKAAEIVTAARKAVYLMLAGEDA
jgi:DNA-binding PadR family transcriptional regulator